MSGRLSLVEHRVRQAFLQRRSTDPDPDDPLRGLHLSADQVWRLLDGSSPVEADGPPLRDLAHDFGLTALDVDLLLLVMLPDLDRRYEKVYGYLNDDVTQRRATPALALELCGLPSASGAARARLAPGQPLADGGLLLTEDADRPFLTRTLRVPDRVIAHLSGDDSLDHRLSGLVHLLPGPGWEPDGTAGLAAALSAGNRLFYLHDPGSGSPGELAAAALAAGGRRTLHLDLDALAADPAPAEAVAAAVREARLTGAGIAAGPVEPDRIRSLRVLLGAPVPVLLTGRSRWDPLWAPVTPVPATAPPAGPEQREKLWQTALAGYGTPVAPGVDTARELAPYALTAAQTGRAAVAAAHLALLDGSGAVTAAHLRSGVRTQNAAGLEQLSRRVEPAVTWDDLVLPGDATTRLRDLAARVRHRDQVLGRWRMRPGGGRGRGVTALFAGDSGTGKTMSAEVVAADLGLDLYVVDLSTVVDKYVGQTEKNLERIFTEAAGVNGVLLFDEADAIFGKRSEVGDAHDRYANMESAYLLQRMESFDGVAVLTTNLRANLDEAFIRRLDVIVDFPVPDQTQRRALWDHCLGRDLPRAADLDLDHCARVYELSGGAIRACAVTAAYLAAAAGGPVTMAQLVAAARGEYRKLGRLLPTH